MGHEKRTTLYNYDGMVESVHDDSAVRVRPYEHILSKAGTKEGIRRRFILLVFLSLFALDRPWRVLVARH